MIKYKTKGTCSREIQFDIEDGKIKNVKFIGGCMGNTQGVARLAEGMDAVEAARRMRGIDCQGRGTSCPDQFAQAIEQALNNK